MTASRTRLGIEAENMGRPVQEPGLIAMAQAIEHAGADSISVSDHLLSFTGENPTGHPDVWLEALTSLAAISSVTNHAKLIASVIILPQRNLLEFMKVTSTLQYLSNGRLLLGVGSGWNRPEMAALGHDFSTRGQRMDEMLTVLRGLQGEHVPALMGSHISVPDGVLMSPAPDRIPLYIGGAGVSKPSLRRTLRFGDGWMLYSPAGHYDAGTLASTISSLQEQRSRQQQPPLDTIFKLRVSGHADDALEREVAELAAIGFHEVIVQEVWDAGLAPGIAAIERARRALDG